MRDAFSVPFILSWRHILHQSFNLWGLSKWVISENRLYPANRPETKQFCHRSNGTSPKHQETKIKSYVRMSAFNNAMEKNAKTSSHGNKEIEY